MSVVSVTDPAWVSELDKHSKSGKSELQVPSPTMKEIKRKYNVEFVLKTVNERAVGKQAGGIAQSTWAPEHWFTGHADFSTNKRKRKKNTHTGPKTFLWKMYLPVLVSWYSIHEEMCCPRS